MNYMVNFVKNVKVVCRMKGIKVGGLEGQIGMQVGYLSRFENGYVSSLRLNDAVKIAEIVDYPIEKLIYGDVEAEEKILELRERVRMMELEYSIAKDELKKLEEKAKGGKT